MLRTYSGVFVDVVYARPKKEVFKNNKYMSITMLVPYMSFQFMVEFTKQKRLIFS